MIGQKDTVRTSRKKETERRDSNHNGYGRKVGTGKEGNRDWLVATVGRRGRLEEKEEEGDE